MAKKTIDDIEVEGRRVLMRVDFNVPIEDGEISDDRRIASAMESIGSVLDRGGSLVLMSHLGRPEGQGYEGAYSLAPVRERLEELLNVPVGFATDCVGRDAADQAASLHAGEVLLLENLRFHAAETLIDKARKNPDQKPTSEQSAEIDAFARKLADLGDLYCNDAFGTCHRKHASLYNVPLLMGPGHRVCGILVARELRFLGDALADAKRPFTAILGGAKVSDKIGVIDHLLNKVDTILIGGAMAYTFLASRGSSVGKSLCESDKLDLAREILQKAGDRLKLPTDSVCATALSPGVEYRIMAGEVPANLMGLDIGPETVRAYRRTIERSKTIVWNGPMGAFETPPFDEGTRAVAQAVAEATDSGATTIIGGGDSAAAVEEAGLADRMSHISTGGGASLEFLEGKPFATIDLLDDA